MFFFSNQYFGRKFTYKGSAQEDYDRKMIEPEINTKHDSGVDL